MMQDDDDNDDPMILNIRAKNHTSERTIVPWTVIFLSKAFLFFVSSLLLLMLDLHVGFAWLSSYIELRITY